MTHLPYPVSEYIRKHFLEGYLKEAGPVKDTIGRTSYLVEIIDNELLHRLEFSEDGALLSHHTEPLFEDDYEEGFFGSDNM
jgi:hypothetical protein